MSIMSQSTAVRGSTAGKWHGIAALAWLVVGYGVTRLFTSVPALHNGIGLLAWALVGYFGPALLLAISGFRRGSLADRVCGALVLVAFAALSALTLYQQLRAVG